MIFAVQAIQKDPSLSIQKTAKVYEVILATLGRRLKGRAFRRNSMPNSRKLTELEEMIIIEYVLDLEARSFPPRLCDVEDMVCWWETQCRQDRRQRESGSPYSLGLKGGFWLRPTEGMD